ncbi:hypothetical protein EJA70_23285 [Pseudomonas sp. PB103]|nr:hypothetical protein EJA70_23285 [Pseudomonas sp. PB103]
MWVYPILSDEANHCGSWLASDGGLSANIDVECVGLIAGKPAPTGFYGAGGLSQKPCGVERATRASMSRPRGKAP